MKHLAEAGVLVRNPDDPARPTNSGRTVYQVEQNALELFRSFSTLDWTLKLKSYLTSREEILRELGLKRSMVRIPVRLPSGETVTLSPGGQNPLIRAVIEEFCPRFVPGGTVVYIGDAEDKFLHLDSEYLSGLCVTIPASPRCRTWLFTTHSETGSC